MTEWRNTQIKDFCFLNPKTFISKGSIVKKIGMEKLTPFCRKIEGFTEETYSSGTKFQNGDILLARITPCLENGKTAFVDILEEGEIAFGSTEFIVLRKKEGVSDVLFLYYLAISPNFRERAISLMNGTSGRQRVEATPLGEEFFSLPPLEIQRKIAGILGALDDKIEVLREQNKTLEQMAQAVFQSWFVDFDIVHAKAANTPTEDICKKYHISPDICALFPDSFSSDNLPQGWEKKKLGDFLLLSYGKALKENDRISGSVPVYGSSGQIGMHNASLVKAPGIIVGRKGTVGSVIWCDYDFYPIDTVFYVQFLKEAMYWHFTYFLLKNLKLQNLSGDSAVPGLNRDTAYAQTFVCSRTELLSSFEEIADILFCKIKNNKEQIRTLEQTRDTLLPQLLSGKIDVENVPLPPVNDEV